MFSPLKDTVSKLLDNEVFRNFVEKNLESLLIIEPDGRIAYGNDSICTFIGISAEQIVGLSIQLELVKFDQRQPVDRNN